MLSDLAATHFPNTKQYLDYMSEIILGVDSGPSAPLRAIAGGSCLGWGRDPSDCPENLDSYTFLTDTGFHEDYQDYHNQVFHFWASVAAIGAESSLTRDLSTITTYLGLQVLHEWFEGEVLGSQGASWEDANLTDKGMDLGRLLSKGELSPSEVGNWLRDNLSIASNTNSDMMQGLIPLSGNFEEEWYEERNNYFEALTQQGVYSTPSSCQTIARESSLTLWNW